MNFTKIVLITTFVNHVGERELRYRMLYCATGLFDK